MTATLTPPAPTHAPPRTRRGGRTRETVLFLVAIALIALHVLDDNFLQPNAGTSAGDHLVSGLVPLALLGLAAWAYPRLRGGRRGALALVLGVLGIAGGVEGYHYAREVGASGDDFTSLLCFPAGLLLLGLGAVTLWRTRRTDGSIGRRVGRRAPARRRRVLRRAAGRHRRLRLRDDARRPCRRAGQRPRRRARGREVHDQRRARARGLVRPVEERRRRDLVPRPQRPAGEDAHARPPRLRRAAVRPPRRGQERRRPELLGLGRRPRRQGRDRLAPAPARRRPRPHRRHRALRRRRDDDRDRR